MSEEKEPSGAKKAFGEFAPGFVHFTDDVLFGQVWPRTELSPKERSLVTVSVLATLGASEQLVYHLGLAKETATTRPSSKKRSPTSPSTPAGRGPCPPWLSPSRSSASNQNAIRTAPQKEHISV